MLGMLARVAILTVIYLLVLGYPKPGDVLVGVALAVALVAGERFIHPLEHAEGPPPQTPALRRLAGVPALIGGTVVDMVRGSVTVARYCLRRRPPSAPGVVTIPIGQCPPSSATAWGIRVGLAPDSIVVDIDERQGRMLIHVLDAHDPDAVRAEQRDLYERRQRRVFP